jgi:hypothetical protein
MTMDPNDNLREQRTIAARLVWLHENDRPFDPVLAARLAELVITLDAWILNGGFLPDSWQ